jgi:membrane protein implicated in regulation of membrane protease activity
MDDYIIWIIIIIISIIVEALTLGLTSIWFAAAGVVALLVSFTGVNMYVQVAIFLVLSVVMLVFLYPTVKDKLRIGNTKTNYEAIIGKTGIVTEQIDNINSKGQVKVQGQMWTARSLNDDSIEAGALVIVQEIKGVKLIVTKET